MSARTDPRGGYQATDIPTATKGQTKGTCPSSRLFGNLPKTPIDLNGSLSA